MSITFKQASQAADAILKSDKAKLQWAKLPLADMPQDIRALAIETIGAEIKAKQAREALQSALDDKVDAPRGKRLVVTLGRQVSSETDSVLVAWADEAKGQTRVISFDQFVKG